MRWGRVRSGANGAAQTERQKSAEGVLSSGGGIPAAAEGVVRTRARAIGGMKLAELSEKIYAILTIASLDCCLPAMRWREFYQRQIEHSSSA